MEALLASSAEAGLPDWMRTDLVAVMPASIAKRMAASHAIETAPLPLDGGAFEWGLYWHKRYSTDAGHEWLRRAIAETCRPLRNAP